MVKKILGILLAFAMVTLQGCDMKNEEIRFGAAKEGGMYYNFSNSFANTVSDNDKYTFDIKETAGSVANLRLLSKGYVDLAIAQADLIYDAYNGAGEFKDNEYKGYTAIAGLYTEACQIVVRADSNIENIDELQGKKVSIGEKESGSEKNAKQILKAYGLTDDLIETVNLDYKTAADKLKSGEIDGFFFTAGVKTDFVEELAKQCSIKLLSIEENKMNKIMYNCDYYEKYTIPANTYNGQSYDVTTIGVQAVLLASDKLEESIVYNITKQLYENKDRIKLDNLIDFKLDIEKATAGVPIKFHSGAEKYYKEVK